MGKSLIGRKLILFIVAFSSVITIATTTYQLFTDYKRDVATLNQEVEKIRSSQLKGIRHSLWNFDEETIRIMLDNMVHFYGVEYLKLSSVEGVFWEAGKVQSSHNISNTFTIYYSETDKTAIGDLIIISGVDPIIQTIYDKALLILASNIVKTFAVAIFALIVFRLLVSRHLLYIASYLRTMDFEGYVQLSLPDKKNLKDNPDEIDQITLAINAFGTEQAKSLKRINAEIKSHKQTAQKLKESEAQLRSIIEGTNAGYFFIDKNGIFKNVNDAWLKLHKFESEDQAIGKHFSFTQKESDMENATQIVSNTLEKGVTQHGEFSRRCMDGSIAYHSFTTTPVFKDREIIGLEGFIIDTTEQKTMENELKESEKKYRRLINLAQEGIWVIDANNLTTFVNPSMSHMLGYAPDEMIGKHLFDFMDDRGVKLAKANLVRREQGIKEQHDFEFVKKNSNRIYTTIVTAPILGEDGSYEGAVAGVIDITDRKTSEAERLNLQKKLVQAQKLESIGNLAGGIAHDFNNILSSILGFTDLAIEDVKKMDLEDHKKAAVLQDSLHEVYTAGERAKELVKQILAFARKSEEELKPVQVDIIITEVLKFIRSSIPATIEIKSNISSNSLMMGNQTQLHQIMMNLCTNASHAMEENGGCLTVNLKDISMGDNFSAQVLGLESGDYIQLAVSDTGKGIHPDIIDSIFEPYFTTKKTGEGTGMGLATVHGLVESYGGKITVKSRIGKGSTFIIYFPLTHKRRVKIDAKSENLPTGSERILFVDDEASIAKVSARALENLGYRVTTQTSSREALELFRSNPGDFDLVITDMTMPQMTGDVLSEKLMSVRPDLPVVLCTGYSNKVSNGMIAKTGIKAIAYKPLTLAEIAKTVRNVLDG